MAEFDADNPRIDRLYGEMQAAARESSRRMEAMERDCARRVEEERAQLNRMLKESRGASARAFQSEVMRVREQMSQALTRLEEEQLREQKESGEEYRRFVQAIHAEKEALEARVNALTQQASSGEENARNQAEKKLREMRALAEETDKTPHGVFFPGKYEIIRDSESKARLFYERGMYEAAAGYAAVLMTDYELLRSDTDRRRRQWEYLYAQYVALMQVVRAQVHAFEETPFATACADEVRMDDAEKDFWSSGAYTEVMGLTREAEDLIADISAAGTDAYLRGEGAGNALSLNDRYYKLRGELNRIGAALYLIRAERSLSDERYDFAEKICAQLSANGYDPEELWWDEADEYMASAAWYRRSHAGLESFRNGIYENEMGSLHIVARFGTGGELYVDIVPERRHGVCESNRIVLSVFLNTMKDAQSARQILETNRDRIAQVIGNASIEISADAQELPRAQPSSIEEQERYLNLTQGGHAHVV